MTRETRIQKSGFALHDAMIGVAVGAGIMLFLDIGGAGNSCEKLEKEIAVLQEHVAACDAIKTESTKYKEMVEECLETVNRLEMK